MSAHLSQWRFDLASGSPLPVSTMRLCSLGISAMTFEPLLTADLDRWIPCAGGRELQFFATDEDVQAWLLNDLPAAYAPYQLVGADIIREGTRDVHAPFQGALSEFLRCRQGPADPR